MYHGHSGGTSSAHDHELENAMTKFRMTSCPISAASFTDERERQAATKFAQDHKAANYLSLNVNARQADAYGEDRVHLPTFMGDLWVARG